MRIYVCKETEREILRYVFNFLRKFAHLRKRGERYCNTPYTVPPSGMQHTIEKKTPFAGFTNLYDHNI